MVMFIIVVIMSSLFFASTLVVVIFNKIENWKKIFLTISFPFAFFSTLIGMIKIIENKETSKHKEQYVKVTKVLYEKVE